MYHDKKEEPVTICTVNRVRAPQVVTLEYMLCFFLNSLSVQGKKNKYLLLVKEGHQ